MKMSLTVTILLVLLLSALITPAPMLAQEPASDTESPVSLYLPLTFNQSGNRLSAASVPTDLTDMLVLYDSNRPSEFDPYFCRLATFYGLLCRTVALNETALTPSLLQDEQGNSLKLIAISAATLRTPLLDQYESDLLKHAVTVGGAHLYVAKADSRQDLALLKQLTDGAVPGVYSVKDTTRDWKISTKAPAVTGLFSGLSIQAAKKYKGADYAIDAPQSTSLVWLISGTDSARKDYAIFVQKQCGAGSIFVDAGMSPGTMGQVKLTDLYCGTQYFSTVTPLMMAIQHAFGAEAWHNDHMYANFTIDDPALQTVKHLLKQWKPMDYLNLLPEMQAHNFHTTIAWQPRNWQKSDLEIVDLFLRNPTYFSIAQHGNNHDGFEFYKYTAGKGDRQPARPFNEQVADLQEGLARIEAHYQRTGIPYDRIMIFPYGNGPVGTLAVLKQNDYLATVQGPATPLMAAQSQRWDYDMYPANLDFANFPLVRRVIMDNPNDYDPISFAQTLFLHKPILLSSHSNPMFGSNIRGFNPVADTINTLAPTLEWQNLGYILTHMYLQKVRDDGAIDVLMQGNHIVLENAHAQTVTYHLAKEEILNVPIDDVTVNGHSANFTVTADTLRLTVVLSAHSTADIFVDYNDDRLIQPTVQAAETEENWAETWDEADAREEVTATTIFIPLVVY